MPYVFTAPKETRPETNHCSDEISYVLSYSNQKDSYNGELVGFCSLKITYDGDLVTIYMCNLADIGPVSITTDPKKFQQDLQELFVQVGTRIAAHKGRS